MEEQRTEVSSQEMLKTDRYLWIARAFSAVAVLAIVANVLLFAAISSLYPLVRVQPFYLNVLDKNQQVIEITPLDASELGSQRVIEAFVRQYVLARFEIGDDVEEVKERFGINGTVALMSSPDTYKEFLRFYQGSYEKLVLTDGLTVKAFIDTADTIKDNFTWQVNLTLEEATQSSMDSKKREVVIQMQVQFDPLFNNSVRTATWQDRLKNPLGFRVVKFKWDEKK